MRLRLLAILLPTFMYAVNLSAATNPRMHRGPLASRTSKVRPVLRPKATSNISPERAAEIQAALIKTGYLIEASGAWDAGTQAAMEKLQADHGWQTKVVPDARALIVLGLGSGSASNPVAPL